MLPEGATLHFQNWYVTRLREAAGSTDTTIYVDTPPEVGSGILVLEASNNTKREIIYFEYAGTGYALTGCVRGLEGTTANTHSTGAAVSMDVTAMQLEQSLNMIALQGMGEDQNNPMSQYAIKHALDQINQSGLPAGQPVLSFIVSDTQPTAVAGKTIVWFEPLD